MTREELIEKVASSIYKVRNGAGCQHWGRLPNSHKPPYIQDANAAINTIFAVLKEPTRDMQQVVSANWGRRTWSEYQDVINASPIAPEEKK